MGRLKPAPTTMGNHGPAEAGPYDHGNHGPAKGGPYDTDDRSADGPRPRHELLTP